MRKFLSSAPGARRTGLVRAMEDDTPDESVEAGLGDNAESVETELAEVTDSEADGADQEAQVDDAADVSEALEQYQAALESAVATGGLDRNGGALLQIGLDNLYNRAGISTNKRAQLSQESFGQHSSKLGATTIALEDIKEQIKKIWDSIVKAVKRIVAWVKEHFNKVFGTAEKLQKRAKALAEKVGSITGAPKEKTLENERLVKALHIGNNPPANLAAGLDGVKAVADEVFGAISESLAEGGELALKVLESDHKDGVASIKKPAMKTNGMTEVTDPEGKGFGNPGDGMKVWAGKELPGGKALIMRGNAADASGEDAVSAFSHTSIALSAFDPKAKDPTKTAVATLNPSDASKIAEKVATLAGEVVAYKAKLGKLTAIQDKIAAAAEKLSKSANDETDKDVAATMRARQKIAQVAPVAVTRTAVGVASYVLNTGKAACDYIELSMKQYG